MSKKRRRRSSGKTLFRRRTSPGATPGSIAVDPEARQSVVRVIAYDAGQFEDREIRSLDQLQEFLDRWPVTWLNVEGLGNAATIQKIGTVFRLHKLALEDVVNVHQRAKVEDYQDHLFITARMVEFSGSLETEQISFFLGKNFVLTFQERPGDCLEPVRERIRKGQGQIRQSGADYLAYALLDAIIDNYFPVLEHYTERIEELDEQVTAGDAPRTIARIHSLRRDLLLLRRTIWPHREAINALARDPNPLISGDTRLFLRDCADHTVQIIDLVETYREMCSDLRDYCLSAVSNRMNEIMNVLTVIATIFIPLSFIAGVYGMNFDPAVSPWNMPELKWFLGYPFALASMLLVAGGMLYFFRRRGWLGATPPPTAATDHQENDSPG